MQCTVCSVQCAVYNAKCAVDTYWAYHMCTELDMQIVFYALHRTVQNYSLQCSHRLKCTLYNALYRTTVYSVVTV